jgi:hypothetical protein
MAGSSQALKVEQLLHLHRLTKDVSTFCRGQLKSYLDAMAPLFRPRRLLGEFIEGHGRETALGAEKNLASLSESYRAVAGRPFDLRKELTTPLESLGTQIQIYEWESMLEVRTERERRALTVVSPLTWVLAYPSTYSLSMLRQVIAGKQERDQESVRAFVLRACIMNLLFLKLPALSSLFEGLRYRLEVRKSPQLGELPLVTISAPVLTMRPPDDLLLVATGLSGGSVFEEILDIESARSLRDPFREQLSGIFARYSEEYE